MGNAKRERQRAGRQARMAAVAAQRRRESRKRGVIGLAVLAGVIGLLLVVFSRGGDDNGTDNGDVAAGGTTTSTVGGPTTTVVAGPCVAVADALPAGAPDIPVELGPPPARLVTRDLVEGTGAVVPAGASVVANYIGVSCSTGVIFDSSYSRGTPTPFSLGGVIKGWQDGIPGMKVGGRRLLGIPAVQAYGADGRSPSILPNEALWFVVEIVAIN